MKRMTTIALFTVCLLAIGSWSYAQCGGCSHGNSDSAMGAGHGMNFVDSDGDGVCDNAGSKQCQGNAAQGCQKMCQSGNEDGHEGCNHMEQSEE